jgi:hypothetical protein
LSEIEATLIMASFVAGVGAATSFNAKRPGTLGSTTTARILLFMFLISWFALKTCFSLVYITITLSASIYYLYCLNIDKTDHKNYDD